MFQDDADATLPPSHAAADRANNLDPTLPPDSALRTPRSALSPAPVRYFGDYELIEEIARGGMGVVYKARQVNLNRIVALKMILAGQLAGPQDVQRFYTEAEAAAQLDHPGIVPIYEIGQHEGQHYFSMGFIEGESLAARVAAGPLPPREAAEIVRQIAEAVHYAHERGVIHRDLKPANILLKLSPQSSPGPEDRMSGSRFSTLSPRTMVTDFGLAKRIQGDSALTGTGQILGTPSYMPPEQAAGKLDQVGVPSDVYSLGAVLYCLLTGRPPFQAATTLDTLLQVLNQDPVPLRQLNPQLDPDLETICLKCLQKEPNKRYASAGALKEDLRRFLNGEAIVARPVDSVERAIKWIRRNPLVAGLSALVVFALLLGSGVSTYFGIQAVNKAAVAEERRKKAEFEWDRAERQLYASQISAAQREWEAGNARAAGLYLALCRHDFRDWEHDYLFTLLNRNQQTFYGHRGGVWCVAFSPDGKSIASGSSDTTAKLWDAATGLETLTLSGHTGAITSLAFAPDGKRVVTGSEDNTLKIWDVATGQETITHKGHRGHVLGVAVRPDGKQIVSGSVDQTLKIWDAGKEEASRTLQGHSHRVSSVVYSPDGTRILSSSYGSTLKLWDAATGEAILTLEGHANFDSCAAFSPDGKKLVSGGSPIVNVWDALTGQQIFMLKGHTNVVHGVAFSPDGKWIASGCLDRMLKVWDAATGQELRTFVGHHQPVLGVAFSPDGKRIVTGSGDNTLKLWDPAKDQQTPTNKGTRGVGCMAFSPDGKQLVTGGATFVQIRAAETGEEILALRGHTKVVLCVAFSPDGKRIASGSLDKSLKVWDAVTGQETLTLDKNKGPVACTAFSVDGKWIISGCADNTPSVHVPGGGSDGTIQVRDAATGQEVRTLRGHTMGVLCLACSTDGTWIVSGSEDTTLKVWNAATGQERHTLGGHTGAVTSVAVSPDGNRIASGCDDARIRIWDVSTGQELLKLKGHTYGVNGLAFSLDGKRLVSASHDTTLKVWDTAAGLEMLTLKGHDHKVSSVAFSPDGIRIVSGSFDRTLKFWDAGQKLGTLWE